METLNNIVLTIQNYMSNYILVIALLGAGLWFSIRLGFIQVRGFGESMRRTFGGLFSKKGAAGKDGMSSFQALATAIAAQVGTGNIAGAATALAIGGAGAIFWMWIAAFLGMATIYAEAQNSWCRWSGNRRTGILHQSSVQRNIRKSTCSTFCNLDHISTWIYG